MSNGMDNGKILKEIYERVVRLDEWRVSVDKKIDGICEIFKPDGTYAKSGKRIESAFSHIKIQWYLLGALFVAYVVRLFM